MGSSVLNLLRQEEKRARLRFWKMLASVTTGSDIDCPFSYDPPENAEAFGVMPKYIRAPFMRAYNLRLEERKGEAAVFEEAVNDLMLEHFKKTLEARKKLGKPDVGYFYLGKEWRVYAMPLNQ